VFPGNLIIQTRHDGLVPLSTIKNNTVLWSGYNWVEVFVERADKDYAMDIKLADGTIIPVLDDTPVLTVGTDRYKWKRADELRQGDYMCSCLGSGSKLKDTVQRTKSYWLGCIFAGGYKYKKTIKVLVPVNRYTRIQMGTNVEHMHKYGKLGKIEYKTSKRHITLDFSGITLLKQLRNDGATFNDDNQIEAIPPGVLAQSGLQRRAFCKGILDILGSKYTVSRNLHINLGTDARAHSVRQLFRSIGVEAIPSGDGMLFAKKWLASLELNIPCRYPKWEELTDGKSAPYDSIMNFLNTIERIFQNNPKSSYTIGITRLLHYKIKRAKGKLNIHPGALRAAWRRLKWELAEPVYDSTPIVSITTHEKPSTLYHIKTNSLDHQITGNEYILGDSVGEMV